MPQSERSQAPAEPLRRGRILRLKHGYNPNSSSIGTIVYAMPAALVGLTIAFGAAAGLISGVLLHRRGSAAQQPRAPQDTEGPQDTAAPETGEKRPPDSDDEPV